MLITTVVSQCTYRRKYFGWRMMACIILIILFECISFDFWFGAGYFLQQHCRRCYYSLGISLRACGMLRCFCWELGQGRCDWKIGAHGSAVSRDDSIYWYWYNSSPCIFHACSTSFFFSSSSTNSLGRLRASFLADTGAYHVLSSCVYRE